MNNMSVCRLPMSLNKLIFMQCLFNRDRYGWKANNLLRLLLVNSFKTPISTRSSTMYLAVVDDTHNFSLKPIKTIIIKN
jgi:hypothetical protein